MLLRIVVLYWSLSSKTFADSSVKPLRYNLTILTHLNGGGAQNQYEGIVSIDIEAIKYTRNIYLNSKDLNMFKEKTWLLRWASGRRISAVELRKNAKKPDEIILIMEHPLKLGEKYTLHIFFMGGLNRPQRYGYFSGYYDKTPRVFFSVTHLEPDYAHTAFPCFNNPSQRATFNITMVHHKKFVALSNMPAIMTTPHEDITDYVWTTFMGSPPMSTNQIMWTLHQLEKISSSLTASGENVTVWARSHLKQKLEKVAEMTPNLLSNFETLFAHPMPKDPDWGGKYDYVVLPGYSEVYSGKGLIVIDEDEIDPIKSSFDNMQEMLAELLARQWNGVLASTSDKDGTYVRDGINNYLAYQAEGMQVNGSHNMTHFLNTRQDVLYYDSLADTKSIVTDVRDPGHQRLRKHKICLLTHMVKVAFGEKVFYEGLKEFFQRYAKSSTTTEQLLEELQRVARRYHQLPIGVVLTTVMESWLKQPGYPLLTVLRNDEDNKVTITQSRYYQSKLSVSSKNCWWVPVIYIGKNYTLSQLEWLGCSKNKADEMHLKYVIEPKDWLLLNVDAAVPLRVLYDLYNWRLISGALNENFSQIPELSRAQLVDDALNLAWSGQLPYNASLNLVSYLSEETSVVVWQTALISLEKLQSIMRMSTGYRIFKIFMHTLIEPSFKATFTTSSSSKARTDSETSTNTESPENEKSPRNNIIMEVPLKTIMYRLACQYEIKECLTDAQQLFQSAMDQKSISSIPEGLRETVLCMGIRKGLEDHWVIVRDMLFEATDENEKRVLLNSLSCTTEYWAMQKLLRWTLDEDKIPKSMKVGLMAAVMRTDLGFYVGNQFLIDNMEKILRRYANNDLKLFLKPFINAVTTENDLTALQNLLKNKLPSSMTTSIASMLEPATDKTNWRKYHYYDLLKGIRGITMEDDPNKNSLWDSA
ncbi:aminopeptidase Q [Drosophila eugracilis]|uniref:aminopeptidase Q n=1 Tax=Drosophila eugracilis TaxID=29029 RepID=UPI0007E5C981|nr:aminopeptidase Q [Drosophila eugracilis]